jgi:hypothetical protein
VEVLTDFLNQQVKDRATDEKRHLEKECGKKRKASMPDMEAFRLEMMGEMKKTITDLVPELLRSLLPGSSSSLSSSFAPGQSVPVSGSGSLSKAVFIMYPETAPVGPALRLASPVDPGAKAMALGARLSSALEQPKAKGISAPRDIPPAQAELDPLSSLAYKLSGQEEEDTVMAYR